MKRIVVKTSKLYRLIRNIRNRQFEFTEVTISDKENGTPAMISFSAFSHEDPMLTDFDDLESEEPPDK